MLLLEAAKYWEAPDTVRSVEWLEDNLVMPRGTETGGMPFSVSMFPHVEGVCDAFDNPSVRRIVLQWGTRLGKTTTCLSLMAKVAATRPRNMMLASSTKDAIAKIVKSRLYPLLDSCEALSRQLPIPSRRGSFLVKLIACLIFVGWSGSDTSLADVGAQMGVAIEVDKWDADSSFEADPLDLYLNRFKGFTDHKVILESTPTIRNRSRIERELLASNQHVRQVPCPHCGEYQVLKKGNGVTPGGIKWEHDSHGKSDPELAFRTAYYECEKCLGRIEDYHRVPMLRAGKWVPMGCEVSIHGEITGQAYREGSDTVGFGPLPSWYALTERWGSFARAWVRAQRSPRSLQDVVNSYLAETWETIRAKASWEELGKKIIGEFPPEVIPAGCSLVTAGVDRQVDHFVYFVEAWAPGRRSRLIDYGIRTTLDQVCVDVIRRAYPHQDGGPGLMPCLTLIDSGYSPTQEGGRDIHEFCGRISRTGNRVLPCKGSSTAMKTAYSISILDKDSAAPGRPLVMVDTHRSQDWIERQLHGYAVDADGGFQIFQADLESHQDLLEQLLNDVPEDVLDASNNKTVRWSRKDANVPNDYRDCKRYADTAMLVATRGGPIPPRAQQTQYREPAPARPKLAMPDGRPFLVTER